MFLAPLFCQMRKHLTKHYIEVLQTTSNPKHRLDAMMMLYLIKNNLDYKKYWSRACFLNYNTKEWYSSIRNANDNKCFDLEDFIIVR